MGEVVAIFGKYNLRVCLLFPWGGILVLCCHWAVVDFQMSALYPVQRKLPV